MKSDRRQLSALKNLISQADHILATTPPLPENRTSPCRELLSAALALADDILTQSSVAPAAILGSKGGSATSKRHGPEHYRRMAARRKTRSGGRPRKESD